MSFYKTNSFETDLFLHKDPISRVHADEQKNNENVTGDLKLGQRVHCLENISPYFLIQVLGEGVLVDGNNLLNLTLHLPQRGQVLTAKAPPGVEQNLMKVFSSSQFPDKTIW